MRFILTVAWVFSMGMLLYIMTDCGCSGFLDAFPFFGMLLGKRVACALIGGGGGEVIRRYYEPIGITLIILICIFWRSALLMLAAGILLPGPIPLIAAFVVGLLRTIAKWPPGLLAPPSRPGAAA